MQLCRQRHWPQDDVYVEQTKPTISTVGGNGVAITVGVCQHELWLRSMLCFQLWMQEKGDGGEGKA